MAAVNCAIKIEPVIVPGGVDTTSSAIDIHVAGRVNRGPGVGIIAHYPDSQLVGDPEIQTQSHSAGGEVVTLRISVGVYTNKITEAGHPDAPTVFTVMLK